MSSESDLAYLFQYLEEEFRRDSEVSVRQLPFRSKGIQVKTRAREYFFPVEWIEKRQFEQLRSEVEKVRRGLSMLSYSNGGVRDDGSPDPYKDY
jgi:hypothetical protein